MQELLENEIKPKLVTGVEEEKDQSHCHSPSILMSQNQGILINQNPHIITPTKKFSESALNGLFGKTINTRKDRNGVAQIVNTTQSHFTLEETQILLQEIMKNGNVLFSNVPGMAKLKVDAWENMAELLHEKLPETRRRPGIQLKKKWENVQMKTRKKILMKQEGKSIEMDTVDNQVIQIIATFFARKSINFTRDININKFSTKPPQNNISNNDDSNGISTNSEKNCSNNNNEINSDTTSSSTCLPLRNPNNNKEDLANRVSRKRPQEMEENQQKQFARFCSVDEEHSVSDHSLLNSQLNTDLNMTQLMASLILKSNNGKYLTDTLMEQLKREHKIRIQTLHFQEVYWQLNLDALVRKCQLSGIPTDI